MTSRSHRLLQEDVAAVLTESEVKTGFVRLFHKGEVTAEVCQKAEELIDQLRPESPLRHRLAEQLDEIRSTASLG